MIGVALIGFGLWSYQASLQQPEVVEQIEQENTITNQVTETDMESQKQFLEDNKGKEGVVTTGSGLQYQVIESQDSGESPVLTSTVQVHYHGTTIDGNVFDSSVNRGVPAEFPLGMVIEGWQEGLQLMKVGEKYKFFIPSELAYGDSSPSPAIPAGATLIFDVELLDVK